MGIDYRISLTDGAVTVYDFSLSTENMSRIWGPTRQQPIPVDMYRDETQSGQSNEMTEETNVYENELHAQLHYGIRHNLLMNGVSDWLEWGRNDIHTISRRSEELPKTPPLIKAGKGFRVGTGTLSHCRGGQVDDEVYKETGSSKMDTRPDDLAF